MASSSKKPKQRVTFDFTKNSYLNSKVPYEDREGMYLASEDYDRIKSEIDVVMFMREESSMDGVLKQSIAFTDIDLSDHSEEDYDLRGLESRDNSKEYRQRRHQRHRSIEAVLAEQSLWDYIDASAAQYIAEVYKGYTTQSQSIARKIGKSDAIAAAAASSVTSTTTGGRSSSSSGNSSHKQSKSKSKSNGGSGGGLGAFFSKKVKKIGGGKSSDSLSLDEEWNNIGLSQLHAATKLDKHSMIRY